jgi:EpsI family protein
MPRGLLIIVVVALLAAAGVVEGLRTNRWGDSEDIRTAASRLDAVPREFGSWTSTESPIDEKVLRVARAAGNVSRTYRNSKTGDAVSVLILCGPTGDIAAHTPDICYAGIGYTMIGRESKHSLALPGATTATYWSARFEKGTEAPLEVIWAWSAGGDWVAAEQPRQEFVLRSALYKVYVSRTISPAERAGSKPAETTREFLSAFLPEVRKALATPPVAAPQ